MGNESPAVVLVHDLCTHVSVNGATYDLIRRIRTTTERRSHRTDTHSNRGRELTRFSHICEELPRIDFIGFRLLDQLANALALILSLREKRVHLFHNRSVLVLVTLNQLILDVHHDASGVCPGLVVQALVSSGLRLVRDACGLVLAWNTGTYRSGHRTS